MNTPIIDSRIRKLSKELNTIPINTPKFNSLYWIIRRLKEWRLDVNTNQFVENIKNEITIREALKEPGLEVGEICGRGGCEGVLENREKMGDGCSCHITAPCSYCMEGYSKCPICEWQMEDA